jgi:hypothetical protein
MGRQLAIVLSIVVIAVSLTSSLGAGQKDSKSLLMNGNAISARVYNIGSISRPDVGPNQEDFVWKGLGYAYETGLLVGSKVLKTGSLTDSIAVVSEGFYSPADGEFSPVGLKWGWLPEPGYANENSPSIAVNTDPSTWPATWSAWPGLWGNGKAIADVESYYVMNDYTKYEYPYYPFPDDTLTRGLGLEVSVRHFQFADANLGDVLFSRYEMKNTSPTALAKVAAGLFSDPHIGGHNDYADDATNADRSLQLAYFWDRDKAGDIPTIKPGYFGFQFDETPVGSGGTELGLTSFCAPIFGGSNRPKNDALMWDFMTPGRFDTQDYYPIIGDNLAVPGTGYFALPSGHSAVLSVGMLLADDLGRLVELAELASCQYRFHFSAGGKGSQALAAVLTAPAAGQKVQSSALRLTWTGASLDNDTTIELFYSNTYDQKWTLARTGIPNSGSYDWDITGLPDGAFYRAYLVNRKGSQAAFDSSTGFFTIDRAGDAAPEIALIAPLKNRILSNTCTVGWVAADAEGDPVTVHISKSEDGGATYSELITFGGSGSYPLDTRLYANTTRFRLKLEASANGKSSVVESPLLSIANTFSAIRDSVGIHHTGRATGKVVPLVFDEPAITGHTYRVGFDSLNGKLVYSVVDQQTSATKVNADTLSTYYGAGRLFDGIRLWFVNEPSAPDSDASGFLSPTVNLVSFIGRPSVGVFVPVPIDLKITFTSLDVTADGRWRIPGDTVQATTGGTSVVCPFRITNLTDTTSIAYIVRDNGTKGRWDFGDEIIVLTPLPYKKASYNTMMGIKFYPPANPGEGIILNDGDSYIAKTRKPFLAGDVYEFSTQGNFVAAGVEQAGQIPLTYALEQNFPNPFNPSTTIRFSVPKQANVRVQIFDVIGREIDRVVDARMAAGSHEVQWDASALSSGVYFIRMTAASVDGSMHFVDTRKAIYMR